MQNLISIKVLNNVQNFLSFCFNINVKITERLANNKFIFIIEIWIKLGI